MDPLIYAFFDLDFLVNSRFTWESFVLIFVCFFAARIIKRHLDLSGIAVVGLAMVPAFVVWATETLLVLFGWMVTSGWPSVLTFWIACNVLILISGFLGSILGYFTARRGLKNCSWR